MVEKIICGNYIEAFEAVLTRIKGRTADLKRRTVLLVPDNYTLYAEKKLCEGNSGFFDVDVVSFNRLFYKLCDTETLGKEQAVMLLRSILGNIKLECFVKSSKYRGFADRIYDTIMLMKKNGITPERLKEFDSPKFKDIAAIYERYLDLSQNYADSSTRIKLLEEFIAGGYFQGCDVYAANFDLLTEAEIKLFDLIAENSDNFIYMGVLPNGTLDNITDNVSVMECNGTAEQLKAIAAKISDAAYNGIPYSEMCVVCCGDCSEHIQRIFGEYSIPYYFDYKYKLSAHPLPAYIISLFNVIKRGMRRRDIIQLVKNPYFGIGKDMSDIFELFCEKFCIDYKGFKKSFTDYESPYAEVCEDIRKKLMGVLSQTEQLAQKEITSTAFYEYIENIVRETRDIGQKFDAEKGIDVCGELLKTVEFVCRLSETASFELLTEIFEDGINSVEIASLPNLSGSVTVGDVTSFRGQRFKLIFLTDFNEGILPRQVEESGILSDYDIVTASLNLATSSEANTRHRSELCMLMSGAEQLFITCNKNDPSGKSTLLKALILKKKIIPFTVNDQINFLYNDCRYLPVIAGARPAAEELLLSAISEYRLFGDIHGNVRKVVFPLYAALGDGIKRFFAQDDSPYLPPEVAQRLFGKTVLSVSRISEFYKCPYLHFIRYGLRLKQSESGEVKANDVGNVLHKIAERFMKYYKGEDIDTFVEELTEKIISEHDKKNLIENPFYFKFLLTEAKRGCATLYSHMRSGDFVSFGEEVHFGYDGSKLKGPEYLIGDKKVKLCGSIDYLDLWKDFARIVDYKTGTHAAFDISEVYYGINLQLALYSYVLMLNGYRPAGMFLFPFKVQWSTDDDKLRMDGIFDKELLNNMDHGFDAGEYRSKVLKAYTKMNSNGGIKLYSSSAQDYGTIASVCEYAATLASRATAMMSEGYIPAKPYSYKTTSCAYCDCRPICRHLQSDGFRVFTSKKIEDLTEAKNEMDN